MKYEDNPRSIKYHVKKYLITNSKFFKGKKVVDFPAGNGVTSRILREIGAVPIPLDLFPEYFEIEGLKCERANIREGLPIEGNSVDALICQEGIEHFSDQYGALKEFGRVLKINGTLLITTPNYSNIRARLSYFLSESERFNSTMPPNELDSIWMSQQEITNEIYFGHIFLIGIQKLRVLAKLSGFRIKKYHFTRIKSTSLILLPFFYPFILLSNWIAYQKNIRKNKDYSLGIKKEVYGEIFKLGISPRVLVGGNLMIEFEKEQDFSTVAQGLRSRPKEFGIT
ncbi:MAG: class I SAM-dependent methyltransferase [Bacteroidales bacterium]|jgi:ubiquinone/menaquinone biosynthesis C-methylase UbiE|nr:class I SAM-dependent methyltransferase [Bacteroidales bacterium]HOI32867.1 class I SAM-dependent methyltransferase [Bacteroidales bacterium]